MYVRIVIGAGLYGLPANMLFLPTGTDTDKPEAYHQLLRCMPKPTGNSPAMGRYCSASSGIFKLPNGKTCCTSYESLKMHDDERIEWYVRAEESYVISFKSSSNYGSWSLVTATLVDLTDASSGIGGTGGTYSPYNVYCTNYIYRWQSQYGQYQYFLPNSLDLVKMTREELREYLLSPKVSRGDTMGSDSLYDNTRPYTNTAVVFNRLYNPKPKPAPFQLGEHFSGRNVQYSWPEELRGIYGIDSLICEAKLKALESIPVDRLNWIDTILQLFSVLTGAIGNVCLEKASKSTSKRVNRVLADAASSGWLSYRYVYSTTKMDLAELKDVSKRLTHLLMQQSKTIHARGSVNRDGIRVSVSLEFSTSQILELNNPLSKLSRMWKYDVWDLIPFSFMVDWLFGVGDFLQAKADNDMLVQCPPVSAWGSVSYDSNIQGYDATKHYSRFTIPLDDLQRVPDYFTYVDSQDLTKPTTILKRSVDALSIGVGLV